LNIQGRELKRIKDSRFGITFLIHGCCVIGIKKQRESRKNQKEKKSKIKKKKSTKS